MHPIPTARKIGNPPPPPSQMTCQPCTIVQLHAKYTKDEIIQLSDNHTHVDSKSENPQDVLNYVPSIFKTIVHKIYWDFCNPVIHCPFPPLFQCCNAIIYLPGRNITWPNNRNCMSYWHSKSNEWYLNKLKQFCSTKRHWDGGGRFVSNILWTIEANSVTWEGPSWV